MSSTPRELRPNRCSKIAQLLPAPVLQRLLPALRLHPCAVPAAATPPPPPPRPSPSPFSSPLPPRIR
eukprot:746391-Hanusia_phi.AAC.12